MEHDFMKTKPDKNALNMAAGRIRPYINRTPVLTSTTINRLFEAEIYFKCENFQKVGAFKARGAMNSILSLDPDHLRKGVATHSSGNHAQALSWAASLMNATPYIVMPENSSRVKVEAVRGYGGKITFCEPVLASRERTLETVIQQTGAVEIHSYNDPRIIAGQATATMELIGQVPDLDIVMAPVGGGGLLSGTALAAAYFKPGLKVVAAEPEQANDAFLSFSTKRFHPSVKPDTIADGLRTSLGPLTYSIILEHVNDIVTVSEQHIIEAMYYLWERMKIIVEPSSAVPYAALLENKVQVKSKKVGIIISGGNVELDNLPWLKHE